MELSPLVKWLKKTLARRLGG
ncbi:hypothetical protein CCACVL1_02400 [Corchorus capsularis]|uniref:Uncharacterized protein n=1 Tax=Corchorus capsularis TaxID=210143 RepID=A0A1R3K8T2_COCAP|nr:hypothetical protein CCACVL1_02400 [Corchorus capsularis]